MGSVTNGLTSSNLPESTLPMIPLSSRDLEILSVPDPFELGDVGLKLDELKEAAARLSNERWYLYRAKNSGRHSNTTFVLPWPDHDPGRRMRPPGSDHPISDILPKGVFTLRQNRRYFAQLERDLSDPSTAWSTRWTLTQMTHSPAGILALIRRARW